MNLSAIVLASGIALTAGLGAAVLAQSQPAPGGVPNVSGTYSGRRCVPANSDVCPEMNVKGAERLMTARGNALIAAFDEVAAPKYDCSPATLPIIFGDPWAVKIEQLPDRVNFTYEKDDVTRTVWLEGKGHQPPRNGLLFMHGYSTGRYEGNQLVIETTKFVFDPRGFHDSYIPSSTQKKVTERYWREGNLLRMESVSEDPLILREPFRYQFEWELTQNPLIPFDCNPEDSGFARKLFETKKYQDPDLIHLRLPQYVATP